MNKLLTLIFCLGAVYTLLPASAVTNATHPIQNNTEEMSQYDSGPMGQFAIGQWQRIRLSLNKKGEGVLTLDPNRIVWDGYSPTWISTRMAERMIHVRARELKNTQFLVGRPKTAFPIRIFELTATDLPAGVTFKELGLGDKVRFVRSDLPRGMSRLLFLDGDRTRVVALDRVSTNTPTGGPVRDLFAYRTVFLNKKVNRASIISISGSLEQQTARLIFDANAMRLDAFGDPNISTMMAPIPQEVKLVEKTDITTETATTKQVFDLAGSSVPMSLVVPKSGGRPARLILKDDAGKATGFLVLEQDYHSALPLMTSSWRLKKIVYSNDVTHTPERNSIYSVSFFADGQIAGRASANRFTGSYITSQERLWVSPLASTRAMSPTGNIEAEYLKALTQVSSYKIEGNELWLMIKYDSGTIILEREPQTKR